MSRRNSTFVKNIEFIERFVEVCGTSKPAEVARLLNISYQAAKNYLEGRLPESSVLCSIAEITPYSIHWLLTGDGQKIVADFQLSPGTREFIKEVCEEIISKKPIANRTNGKEKVIVISSDKIKKEKVAEESEDFSAKQS